MKVNKKSIVPSSGYLVGFSRFRAISLDLFVEDLNFDNLRNKTGKSACYCLSYWILSLPLNFAKFAILQSSPKEKKTWNRKIDNSRLREHNTRINLSLWAIVR